MAFDPTSLRTEFPILSTEVNGRPLVYLDNAATSQKPRVVLDAARHYYEELNSNIHRGTHYLSRAATTAHELARQRVANYLNADSSDEVIFTSGTTDGINLISSVVPLAVGDEIIISALEHHSNIVPWQMAAEKSGAVLRIVPCNDDGVLDTQAFEEMLGERTKIVALTWISNAFGTVNPIARMVASAKAAGALTLVDAAQAIPHLAIDVQQLGADFLVFSGHKVYAPTGVGILWGQRKRLEELPPWRGGGEMIKEVTFAETTFNDLPFKYEAGTPNIEGAISLAAALDFVDSLGIAEINAHETQLIGEAADALSKIDGIRCYGPDDRSCSLSFNLEGVHHYDLGTLIDQMGVAVRTGHHCCQPLMQRFGITGTVRASFALYNTSEEVAVLADSVKRAARMLA